MAPASIADLKACAFYLHTHINMGQRHQYIFACHEHPRLKIVKTTHRKERTVHVVYPVDNVPCFGPLEAIKRLGAPAP